MTTGIASIDSTRKRPDMYDNWSTVYGETYETFRPDMYDNWGTVYTTPPPDVYGISPYAGYYSGSDMRYQYSANLMQAVVAFIEALLFTKVKISEKVFFAAIIFISTFVPPSGLIGYFGPNEKLMETLVATVLASFLITPIYGGSYSKNAIIGFMLSTSSAGFTSATYSYFYA